VARKLTEDLAAKTVDVSDWILENGTPWARLRALVDLVGLGEADPQVREARASMLDSPEVTGLVGKASAWGEKALKRHNDASHPLVAMSVLADFGLNRKDPSIDSIWGSVSSHISAERFFETLVNVPKPFGGSGEDEWSWMACDAYALLYPLLSFGYGEDDSVRGAVDAVCERVASNGWHCAASAKFGKFKGPGKREDPCPISNVHALRALSLVDGRAASDAASQGIEMLLSHWADRGKVRYFMFGIGTDFRKPKYPLLWYDILHVLEVLSRFPAVHADPRFLEMLDELAARADDDGRLTARSMYRAWKEWSFADKKNPSPWLSFLLHRILNRIKQSQTD